MISPKVIVRTHFDYAINNNSHKTHLSDSLVRGMFNYFSNKEKRAINMIDYYTGKINKNENINLITEDGSYATDGELKNRKKRYGKYIKEANLYQVIVSFNNDYINSHIKLEDLEKLMIKKIIPEFLRDSGFVDINKMSYQIALHTNTDNYHFHCSFIEKSPNSNDSNNKLCYMKKGKLPIFAIDNLKRNILLSIDREKEFKPLLIEVNNEIKKLKSYFKEDEHNFILNNKNDLILENDILKLGKLLYDKRLGDNGKIKYNSIYNKQIKTLTYEIKKLLFSNDSKLKMDEKSFKESLNKTNQYFKKLNKENNITSNDLNNNLFQNKIKYVDNYVYNAIINHANKIYRKEIKATSSIETNDIIKEIVLNNYKRYNKKSRFDILDSYLKNMGTNKYKNKVIIRQAVKSINSELEEAQKEFSKLFELKDKSL